tara:strand:- start:2170 stop:2889 length:720 start_codon:yes stop_codon:yes gene_type:complete
MEEQRKPPTVYKVKDPIKDSRYDNIHPHLPQPPALVLLVASVKQGKSNMIVNFFTNPEMYKDAFTVVKVISNTLNADPKGKILKKYFDCEDHYDDSMIQSIVNSQKSYDEDERPSMALVLDDILTRDFKKTNAVSFLGTRFRHYGIDLFCITTQSFRAVGGLLRNNATNVIILKQQNSKELEKLDEEYGDMFSGIFMELYNKAINDAPYSFLHLDLSSNPAKAYLRFETLLAEGEHKCF